MQHKSNWVYSFGISMLVHALLLGFLVFVLPHLTPKEPPPVDIGMPMEMDVPGDISGAESGDLAGTEPGSPDGVENGALEGEIPKDMAEAAQASSQLYADGNGPEQNDAVPLPDDSANAPDEGAPILTDEEKKALEEFKKKLEEARQSGGKKRVGPIIVRKGNGGPAMGMPARLIEDSYPAVGLTRYHGRVTVFATIGVNGRITKTRIAVGTKDRVVNEIAMAACRRWRFKPALDSKGRPMECVRIISIPFNVSNIERQLTEEKVSE